MKKNPGELLEFEFEKEKNKKIINAILNNSNDYLVDVFDEYFKKIRPMVLSFRNSILIPDDIFQDGVYFLIKNVRRGAFKDESSVYGYLHGICKNLCNELLRKKKSSKIKMISLENNFEAHQTPESIDSEEKQIIYEQLNLIKDKLNKDCIDIINLRFKFNQIEVNVPRINKNLPFEEIGKIINKNADTSKHYFLRCIKKLKELIDLDPVFKNYYN